MFLIMSVKRIENVYEVTQRLLGEIEPQGESNIDRIRLQNLKDTINLTEALTNDIILVARHQNRAEFSMAEAGRKANLFIDDLRERLEEPRTETNMECVSKFIEHYERESGQVIPEEYVLSFFNA